MEKKNCMTKLFFFFNKNCVILFPFFPADSQYNNFEICIPKVPLQSSSGGSVSHVRVRLDSIMWSYSFSEGVVKNWPEKSHHTSARRIFVTFGRNFYAHAVIRVHVSNMMTRVV